MATDTADTADTARARGDTLDDSTVSGTTPRFSPVCTYCAHWVPGDGHHCAGAFPRGGPTIPEAIWNGTPGKVSGFYHTLPVRGDHGVTFRPEKGAKVPAKLMAAYQAAQNVAQKDKTPAK